MTLHIFNPDHDLVLAAGESHFTPPKAARQLYADLGFLPALWAEADDIVLVADAEAARERLRHIKGGDKGALMVEKDMLKQMLTKGEMQTKKMDIGPWGWDKNVRNLLVSIGFDKETLPTDEWLASVREISSRQWVANNLLPTLVSHLSDAYPDRFVGQSFVVTSMNQLHALLNEHPQAVVKAPWSSSGRGIRYISGSPDPSTSGWCANMMAQQGCITLEPYYDKVRDFGMEFVAKADGSVEYVGLSLFKTSKRMYTGSLLATEKTKQELLSPYLAPQMLANVSQVITTMLQNLLSGRYVGPFGVDMMVVKANERGDLKLHPCVELNLRRTMGHVALALSPAPSEPQRLMSIRHTKGSYHLRLHTLSEGLLNTSLARL